MLIPQIKKKVISLEDCILICSFILSVRELWYVCPFTCFKNKRSEKDII